jgi:hypothetical protein
VSIKQKILKGYNIFMILLLIICLIFLIAGLGGKPAPLKPVPLPVYYDENSIDFNWVGC